MPGMDGYEVARRLHQISQLGQTALVALTGYGQQEDIQKSHEAGFARHMVKPVDLEELKKVLN
jgi:CheY-like chemotaxis protein